MSAASPLIALVGGVFAASLPAEEALRDELPDATIWNILDDRLITEAVREGSVTPRLEERMARLVEHAALEGAAAVVMTCSMYAFAAERLSARGGIPVLGPDDAAMAFLVSSGYRSVSVVSGVELALNDSVSRVRALLAAAGSDMTVVPVLAPGARAPSLERDVQTTADRIEEAVGQEAEALFLANYSLEFAAEALGERMQLPVITGPAHAARSLREILPSSVVS